MAHSTYVRLAVAILLAFLLGRYTANIPEVYHSNSETVIECVRTLERCTDGWSSTLEVLRDCNNLNKNEI